MIGCDSQIPGWNLPKSALDSPELQQALDYYIAKDGQDSEAGHCALG